MIQCHNSQSERERLLEERKSKIAHNYKEVLKLVKRAKKGGIIIWDESKEKEK